MLRVRLSKSLQAAATSAIILAASGADAQPEEPQRLEESWPKTITADRSTFVVHQPQLESWDGFVLAARAAVAVTETGAEQPLFGVVDFTTRTRVDKTEREVTFDRLEITAARFPSAPERADRLRQTLQEKVGPEVRSIELDRLEAGLSLIEAQMRSRQVPVRHHPPRILFRQEPTLLVTIDGEPVYRPVEKTTYERILNTRPLILRREDGRHFLHLMDRWMEAPALAGPWTVASKIPRKIEKAKKRAIKAQPADLLEAGQDEQQGDPAPKPSLRTGPIPAVLVATEPTEVVVFDGVPNFVPLARTDLLFADNTTGNVFRHLEDQKLYLVVSGRWFRADSADGVWSHTSQDSLPEAFARIPDDSPKENVKASVAGTPQAQEALIANSIPQTAEVDPKAARFEAVYDGEPKLESIDGTSLAYIANSPDPIVRVDSHTYYALHDGIWFYAPDLSGPWRPAREVPAVIYSIPPSSPIHHVTYVKIYSASPEVIVVGYTPGYYGTAVADGVVVYGTGYAYAPWIGSSWYGPPVTYGVGCGITYTPWGGWSFSFGIGWSWGYWGSSWWAPYPSPWWGPYWGWSAYPYYGGVAYGAGGGYAVWGPGGWAGTTGNVYHRSGATSAVTRTAGGYDAWTGTGWRNQVGAAYNSRTGRLAAGQRAAVGNVYTGDYAYGRRGVATGTRTGVTAAGRSATVGNVDSGRQATVRQGAVVGPRSGEATRVGGVSGDAGRVARVGDDVYGARDGEIYRRSGSGWEKMERSGDWSRVERGQRTRDLDRQRAARTQGSRRASGYARSRQAAGSWSRGSFSGRSMRGRRR